jgi:hypothetical protein
MMEKDVRREAGRPQREELPLSKAAQYLLEECRMVLPGIQALFGFQLISVFNSAFAEKLSPFEQHLHLLALALVAVSIALIMAPAAYHRQTGPCEVTDVFIRLASRMLLASMAPLTLSLCIDLYLVARVVDAGVIAPLLAAFMGAIYIGLWFVLPRLRRLRNY